MGSDKARVGFIYQLVPFLKHRCECTVGLLMFKKDNRGYQSLSDLIPEEEEQCEIEYVHVFIADTLDGDLFLPNYCWKPWHRLCERYRVDRMRVRIMKYLEFYHEDWCEWFFITRSVRNDQNLHLAFDDLRDCQKRFSDFEKDNADHPFNMSRYWVSVTEVTHSVKTGYNVHQHMLVRFPKGYLKEGQISYIRDSWSKSAGYQAHFNIRPMGDSVRAAEYLSKYMSKTCWGGLSRGRAYRIRNTLKGRNRINCKRGTVLMKPKLGYYLCCLPPKEYCSHPSMVIPPKRGGHDGSSQFYGFIESDR